MDPYNINRPNNTNTPDIPTGNTPQNPIPPQGDPSHGDPADIQNKPPAPNSNMPLQGRPPYGMPNDRQPQNNNPYGYPNGLQNQNANPYGNPYPNNYQPVPRSPADGLITASMALGIATIVSAILGTVYFPFILGAIGIVLALLSKGYDAKMSSKPKIGVICSVVGLVLNILIVGTSVYKVFTDEQTFDQFDRIYEQMYGESFRDMYRNATGQDLPFNFDD